MPRSRCLGRASPGRYDCGPHHDRPNRTTADKGRRPMALEVPVPLDPGHVPAPRGGDPGQAGVRQCPTADDAGDPVWLTWREVGEQARAIAAGLTTLGVRPEDRVGHPGQHPARVDPRRPRHHAAPARPPPRSTRRPSPRTRLHRRRLRLQGADRRERRTRPPSSPAPTCRTWSRSCSSTASPTAAAHAAPAHAGRAGGPRPRGARAEPGPDRADRRRHRPGPRSRP